MSALHRPVRELHRRQFKNLSPKLLIQLGNLLQVIRDGLATEK